MKRKIPLALISVLLVGVGVAQAVPSRPSSGTVVKSVFNAKLKRAILVDGHGMTLYLFTGDWQGKSGCVDDAAHHCIKVWPALTTQGSPQGGAGVKRALLGTTTRADGTVQVTYANHPLYRFRGGLWTGKPGDRKPGDVRSQALLTVWYVVSPAGAAIK